jgi:RNA polymerase sigma factor (sigma-70 family)
MHETNWHDTYKTLSPKLLGICRRYIKDLASAEDIVQDSFIVAIQKEKDLKNKNALNGWLSKIVVNRAINHLKNKQKINFTSAENFEFIDETTEMNVIELDRKSTLLATDFSHDELLEAIDSLSENHKSVFNLYIIDEFSHYEISKLLNISIGTSKSSLSRARKNIQQFLFDKLTPNKTEEKKKRRIAFLLFLGFGNQLFANYYKKAFSSYEIKSEKALDLSKKIEITECYLPKKEGFISKYLKIGIVLVSCFLLLLFLFENTNTPNVIKIKKDVIFTPVRPKENRRLEKEVIPFEKKVEKKVENKTQLINSNNIVKSDSITKSEIPKVVIIKKQIIKKDTVYVEKK